MIADSLLASGLNRLFAQTPGARDLLSKHAGRIVALDLTLFRTQFRVEENGGLHTATETPAETTIFITAAELARLPLEGKAALRELRSEGDAELAMAFNAALQQIDLDAEAELSRVFGPIIGFRMAEAGRAFGSWAKQAAEDTARTFAEYAVEESPMLASRANVDRFKHEVDQLRDEVSRFEDRINRLTSSSTDDA